jgi:hypothetical protein
MLEIAGLPMPRCYRELFASLLLIGVMSSASAQNRPPDAMTPHTESSQQPAARTGKERLGKKWTDEQRIDNCNVPVDKRGTKPRPGACAASAPRS